MNIPREKKKKGKRGRKRKDGIDVFNFTRWLVSGVMSGSCFRASQIRHREEEEEEKEWEEKEEKEPVRIKGVMVVRRTGPD